METKRVSQRRWVFFVCGRRWRIRRIFVSFSGVLFFFSHLASPFTEVKGMLLREDKLE